MTPAELATLLASTRTAGCLPDTNLLLVYLIGKLRRDLVPRFGRTQAFAVEHFDLIAKIIDAYERKLTTPNILTEVGNLCEALDGKDRASIFASIHQFSLTAKECMYRTSQVGRVDVFSKLGVSDSATVLVSRSKPLVFTVDFDLAHHLGRLRRPCLNFNHIRPWVE
jgi:hypothetical protein